MITDTMQVSLVPKDHVLAAWPHISEHMRRAAEYTGGRYLPDDVLSLVMDLDYLLWVAFDSSGQIKGAVVTGVIEYPRRKCLHLMFCGGEDGDSWKMPMLTTLQRWAKETGCEGIEALGRFGWQKIFKREGYNVLGQVFELPVDLGE